MAGKIFDETLDVNNRIDRNNFDLSEAKHLTTNVGRITPCYINLLPPNSSLQINPTFALKFMPFAYDLQNKLNARISFFKIPLRTIWEQYKDYVGNYDKTLVPPYIDFGNQEKCERMLSVSSLSDYLGLPPIESGSYSGVYSKRLPVFNKSLDLNRLNNLGVLVDLVSADLTKFTFGSNSKYIGYSDSVELQPYSATKKCLFVNLYNNLPSDSIVLDSINTGKPNESFLLRVSTSYLYSLVPANNRSKIQLRFTLKQNGLAPNNLSDSLISVANESQFQSQYFIQLKDKVINDDKFSLYVDKKAVKLVNGTYRLSNNYSIYVIISSISDYTVPANTNNIGLDFRVPVFGKVNPSTDPNDIPFFTSSSISNRQAKISAYPFRAYEAVYNCYYRDMRNNPYYVDGKVQYNKWIPTDKGGADSYEYKLYSANWERDFLTTAQHTPQQGDPNRPPLVGITTYTQSVRNDDGSTTTKENAAIVDENGRKFGLEFDSNDEGLTGVRYTRLADNLSVRSTRSLVDVAESGISIADLRNVNAYQKFLEMNMRKGYSYKDIIEGRFDVKVRYSDLQMPEFIGGVSRDFSTMAVTQMVDNTTDGSGSYKDVLGSQAGLSQVSGSTDGISVFCDEECIILGLLVITPRPVYTQLVPKWFYNRSLLDSFQPEFNHLGYQPIYNREVNPYAAFRGGSMEDVFGYQRPWYDYISKVDTACGLYRTQLTDFLMQRKYNGVPALSVDFLTVKEEDVNNVFTVTDISDKIFGQIYFDVRAKLPIARVAIPKLD